ncbi:pentatricopeptide repeat-containing protein At4g33990 [Ricinus communis]|uniref:pentatricopeptide repeat-containing protein At4g33990 n=1 Tax=Ricinus communis TaxID=3988 RepID=UPI000772822D|nr:pentatricopeptide repeat-containing protein At4g33990 [Ricinus communis]|eukprot:XP_015578450.1 pentatricopeptide repeat-containing protein At4g33990 [Ricinus communis]
MASWSAILRQFDLQNYPFKVISLFKAMQRGKPNDPVSDPFVYASLIKACNKVLGANEGKSIHCHVMRLGLHCNVNILNSLIYFYMSSNRLMSYACQLFNKSPERTIVTVNCMVSGFLKNKKFDKGLCLFNEVLVGKFGLCLQPNFVTLMVLISGCVESGRFNIGTLLHSYCCKTGLDLITEVCNTLIDFYFEYGHADNAVKLFNAMAEKDLVSWNTMIAGYARSNNCRKALSSFREMRYRDIEYDTISFVNLILACAYGGDLDIGKAAHGYIITSGQETPVSLGTVLINMYSRCGLIEFARKVFDELPDMNIASWNSMIHGYVENGLHRDALWLFNKMKYRKVKPDEVTMLGLISACRNSGELSHGTDVHSYIESNHNLNGNHVLQNALIDMYAKCGNMARAKSVFDNMSRKDVISWTSIIVGHAINGEGEEALCAFRQMCEEKVEPNSVTFIGVLLACDHSGLVEVGQNLYDTMCKVYNIEPQIEHYGCMVDMFARAGMLEEANEFVRKMSLEPNAVLRRMMINACRVHGIVALGLSLVSSLGKAKKLDSTEDHVISSNIFAQAGRWDDVLYERSKILVLKASKSTGKSSVSDLTD